MKIPMFLLICLLVIASITMVFALTNTRKETSSTMTSKLPDPVSGAMPPLTDAEKRVILDKGTERPFTGEYTDNKTSGTYICRQCGTPLYRSADKFDSRCGWPAFDTEIPGAVLRRPDVDGERTEILCAKCNGHLGHVFIGEGLTPKNTRHCVNSISMVFVPEHEQAIVAGGCFWGVEDAFESIPGVLSAVSGYTGGTVPDPTYEQVCTGTTGHAEAVKITFDPTKVTYEQLLRRYFEIHDPTQLNRQGPDIGTQYRSAVFTENETQKQIVQKLIVQLKQNGWDVKTTVEDAKPFYPAESYHQDYAARTGRGKCHLPVARFDRKPE